jgi:hypothetical protein
MATVPTSTSSPFCCFCLATPKSATCSREFAVSRAGIKRGLRQRTEFLIACVDKALNLSNGQIADTRGVDALEGLYLAQGGVGGVANGALAAAILIAASSNNILKAAYAAGFAGGKATAASAAVLVALALAGFAAAYGLMTQ